MHDGLHELVSQSPAALLGCHEEIKNQGFKGVVGQDAGKSHETALVCGIAATAVVVVVVIVQDKSDAKGRFLHTRSCVGQTPTLGPPFVLIEGMEVLNLAFVKALDYLHIVVVCTDNG